RLAGEPDPRRGEARGRVARAAVLAQHRALLGRHGPVALPALDPFVLGHAAGHPEVRARGPALLGPELGPLTDPFTGANLLGGWHGREPRRQRKPGAALAVQPAVPL